ELCRRGWRDRASPLGAASAAHRYALYNPQWNRSLHSNSRRKQRACAIARRWPRRRRMSIAIGTTVPPQRARLATWLGFVLMCLGMFMAILDIQVVAASLPAIAE